MLRKHQFSIQYLLLESLIVGIALGVLRLSVVHNLYGFQNVVFVLAVLIGGAALGSASRSRIVGASMMFVVVYLLGIVLLFV
jgi:hypothetical protein